jgi:hypothetical protein
MHPDLEILQRLRHEELGTDRADETRRHVEHCPECRGRIAAAESDEREVMAFLGRLDAPVRPLTFETIATRGSHVGRRQALHAAAAGLLIVALGGVAWAIPGSPLRALMGSITRDGEEGNASVRAPGPSEAGSSPSDLAGIALTPDSGLVVTFTAAAPTDTLVVSLVDGALVQVRALAGRVRFQSGERRLVVSNDSSLGMVAIDIPRDAPRVEIYVGDQRLLLKAGARIEAAVPAAADGSYRLPLR